MVVIITCRNEQGQRIGKIISDKLEMKFEICNDVSELNIAGSDICKSGPSVIYYTEEPCECIGQKGVTCIYLYENEPEKASDDFLKNLGKYDLCMQIGKMGNRACAEAISQFLAIKMLSKTS